MYPSNDEIAPTRRQVLAETALVAIAGLLTAAVAIFGSASPHTT